jgi:hypothetical protein
MTGKSPPDGSSRGEVIRVATNTLAYLVLNNRKEILSFTPNLVENNEGKNFEELGIVDGSVVDVSRRFGNDFMISVLQLERLAMRADDHSHYSDLPRPEIGDSRGSPQLTLHPDKEARSRFIARRAISPETRSFGKLIDCAPLQPGDLLLSCDLKPDIVSNLIAKVQLDGGYAEADARWTHAAMYLGDDENLVEATFDNLFSAGRVRMTSLDEYCKGNYELRFRRSKYVNGNEYGWRLCVRALSRLRQPYDFAQAARLWWDVRVRKAGFSDGRNRRTASEAVICSTLYADAYDEAIRRRLGEIGGVCVPAWLSITDEFHDIDVDWARIR